MGFDLDSGILYFFNSAFYYSYESVRISEVISYNTCTGNTVKSWQCRKKREVKYGEIVAKAPDNNIKAFQFFKWVLPGLHSSGQTETLFLCNNNCHTTQKCHTVYIIRYLSSLCIDWVLPVTTIHLDMNNKIQRQRLISGETLPVRFSLMNEEIIVYQV